MNWRKEFNKLLSEEFQRLQRRSNGRFSLRAFASRLKVPVSTLSQLLSEKQNWKISEKRARDILSKLEASKLRKDRLFELMGVQNQSPPFRPLTEEYAVLLDPTYASVLTCFDLPENERSAAKIAARFGKGEEEIKAVLQHLTEKGYLRSTDSGALEPNHDFIETGDGPPSAVVRQHHKNNLKLAIDVIESVPMQERHYSTLTFAGTKAQMEEVTEEIRRFHRSVRAILDKNETNEEIYRMSICLFPMRSPQKGAQP